MYVYKELSSDKFSTMIFEVDLFTIITSLVQEEIINTNKVYKKTAFNEFKNLQFHCNQGRAMVCSIRDLNLHKVNNHQHYQVP